MKISDIYNKHVSFIKVVDDGGVKYCPPKELNATLLHPRVVIKFNGDSGVCPYCGLKYQKVQK